MLLCVSTDPSAVQTRHMYAAVLDMLVTFLLFLVPAEDREWPDCVEDGGMLSSDDTNLFAFGVSLVWLSKNLLQDYVFK